MKKTTTALLVTLTVVIAMTAFGIGVKVGSSIWDGFYETYQGE